MSVEVVQQPPPRYYFQKDFNAPDPIRTTSSGSLLNPITYPFIKIKGYIGRTLVQVSCVTESVPHRAHPCMLFGENCADGVYQNEVRCQEESTIVEFRELFILSQKLDPSPYLNIEQVLTRRQEMNIDPFKTGFDHINYAKERINLHGVRLCFQIFTEDENGLCQVPQRAVVSNVIRNANVVYTPFCYNILKISQLECLANGRSKYITLHCENLKYNSTKEVPRNAQVCFFEIGDDGESDWESIAITKEYMHDNVLQFRPPKYRNVNITESVCVLLKLQNSNASEYSEAIPFHYLPLSADTNSTDGPSTAT